MHRILLTVLAVLLPFSAMAGTFDDEEGVYTSYLGYEIKPPKGWTYVDMSNIAAMKSSLPNNISPKMFERIDVAFFPEYSGDPKQTNLNADRDRQMKNDEALRDDPSISPEELLKPVVKFDNPPSFSPVITIMSVRAKIDQAAEAPKAYEKEIIQRMKKNSSIENFKVTSSTYDDALAPGAAYVFSYEFSYKRSKTVAVDQTILFNDDQTLVISCTQDVEEYVNNKKWCAQAVNSIRFK